MKFVYSIYPVLTCLLIITLLSSCGSSRLRTHRLESREPSPELFVQTANKEIIPLQSEKDNTYKNDDLIAFQNSVGYFRIDSGEQYMRMMKGKINLYYQISSYTTQSIYATPGTVGHFKTRTHVAKYFDVGSDQPLLDFNRKSIYPITTDCSPCKKIYDHYDRIKKEGRIVLYAELGSLVTSIVLFSLSPDTGFKTDFGAGLAFGLGVLPFFSEAYRQVVRGRNERRLERVVTTYNNYAFKN